MQVERYVTVACLGADLSFKPKHLIKYLQIIRIHSIDHEILQCIPMYTSCFWTQKWHQCHQCHWRALQCPMPSRCLQFGCRFSGLVEHPKPQRFRGAQAMGIFVAKTSNIMAIYGNIILAIMQLYNSREYFLGNYLLGKYIRKSTIVNNNHKEYNNA